MNLDKVKSFIDLAKEEGVSELKYQEKDFKIEVSFQSTANSITPHVVTHSGPTSETQVTGKTVKSEYHEITSPFVGTYYCSPAPGKPNFINVGDRIKSGQTLCILEAMKIMNEIESDIDGEIVEICVDNESLVEFGEVLFRIKK